MYLGGGGGGVSKKKKKRIQALQQSAVRWVKAACLEDFCFVELIIQDRHDGLSQKGFTQAFKCTLKKKKKKKKSCSAMLRTAVSER